MGLGDRDVENNFDRLFDWDHDDKLNAFERENQWEFEQDRIREAHPSDDEDDDDDDWDEEDDDLERDEDEESDEESDEDYDEDSDEDDFDDDDF